jgi:hypothetical protein
VINFISPQNLSLLQLSDLGPKVTHDSTSTICGSYGRMRNRYGRNKLDILQDQKICTNEFLSLDMKLSVVLN